MQIKQLAHSFVWTFMLHANVHARDWWRETGEARD